MDHHIEITYAFSEAHTSISFFSSLYMLYREMLFNFNQCTMVSKNLSGWVSHCHPIYQTDPESAQHLSLSDLIFMKQIGLLWSTTGKAVVEIIQMHITAISIENLYHFLLELELSLTQSSLCSSYFFKSQNFCSFLKAQKRLLAFCTLFLQSSSFPASIHSSLYLLLCQPRAMQP